VLVSLHQGDLTKAVELAERHKLPISQARARLAQGDTSAALAVLDSYRRQVDSKELADEQLKVMILQAVAFHALGEDDRAIELLVETLALVEPGGFIRSFVDEGAQMADLLSKVAIKRGMSKYISKLLAAFESEDEKGWGKSFQSTTQSLIEPLSQRELEILQLVALGLSNREISERLFLALNTIKGHNRRIFNKLQVQRRTEAIARARELDLL
jgi:LuxR family maltose regulon positive regulatory protein